MGPTALVLFNQEPPSSGDFFYSASGGISMSGTSSFSRQNSNPNPPFLPLLPDGFAVVQDGDKIYVKWQVANEGHVAAISVSIYKN